MLSLEERLKESLERGLPGTDVQWIMASSDRMLKDFPRIAGPDARVAAVLILLYPIDNIVHTVFMQRPDYTGFHGGQISFPGGKKEPYDENITATALREAMEETGIDPSIVSVAGLLTPLFIPVSNMIVTPVVGCCQHRPSFSHDPNEVVFLIEASLQKFLEPGIISTRPMLLRGETIDVRYFAYEGHVIWGATAMMLNELLEIMKRDKISLVPD
jgi:8-oxo-dGTP pyrophosphatase MutT (NUDIX family)